LSDTRPATASIAPNCNCMSTRHVATDFFSSEGGGKGAFACLTLVMQLQESHSTATARLPTRLQLTFCFVGGPRREGGVACLTLGMQLQVSPSTTTDLYFVGGWWERMGVVACLTLGMQLQSTQTTFALSVGRGGGGSCMSATRQTTASVALDCNCMFSMRQQLNDVLFGKGAVACLSQFFCVFLLFIFPK
jgi:hypothetical protein